MFVIELSPLGVLALILIVLALTGFLSEQLSVSPILFFILFGMIMGPNAIGIIEFSAEISFLRQIGLILLLFIAGLDFEFDHIEDKFSNAVIIAIPPGIVGFGLSFALYFIVDWFNLVETLLLGLILTTTSISLSVSVLRKKLDTDSEVYQTMILAIILSNVIMILIAGLITRSIEISSFSFLSVFGNFIIILTFIGVITFLSRNIHHYWLNKIKVVQEIQSQEEIERINNQRMRFALGLLGIILLIAYLLQIDLAIAAFFAGIYVNQTTRMKRKDITKLHTLGYGLLIPIFFFGMGMRINITYFTDVAIVLRTLVILVISFIGQVTLTALSSILANFDRTSSLFLGIGLSACSLSGGFAVLSIGYSSQRVSDLNYSIFAAVISVSVLMTIIGLEVFDKFNTKLEPQYENDIKY